MKLYRKLLALCLTAALAAGMAVTASADIPSVKVLVNGQTASTSAYINSDWRTMVPAEVADAMGVAYTVEGDSVTFTAGGVTQTYTAGSAAGDTVASLVDGTLYVPFYHLAQTFGFQVSWDSAAKAASATGELSEENPYAYQQGTLQNTRYGSLEGFEKDGALHWYGVPYAKEPTGELRWKAPQAVEPWEGVLDATESLIASQTKSVQAKKDAMGNTEIETSIELLGSEKGAVSLDITRPNTAETGLPIFFYLHGGNNQTGQSGAFPATQFAQDTNSVVVSINHRLGLLGYNALPALKNGTDNENSGNFGLLDVAAALDWVKENAESFGADGENITVTGSSAGGRNVMAMLISPIFAGKFQKAISYSGGMTTANVEDSQRVEARALAPLAVEKGVKATEAEATEWLLTTGDDVREFLYSLSDEQLAAAFGGAAIRMSAFPHLFADGIVLPKEGFDTSKYNSVPIMMVNGDREFSTFCKSSPPFNEPTEAELMQDASLLSQYIFAEKYGSLMYTYFNGEESAVRMFGKYNAPIYTCVIRWGDNEQVVGNEYATLYGSYHCMTTPMMTGVLVNASAKYPEQFAQNGCKAASAMLNQYYANFLKTGNPNGDGLTQWDAWSSLDGTTQLIVDGDLNTAWAEMSSEHISYEKIIELMEQDNSISAVEKDTMIKTVLNGRWFSNTLDTYYHNINLWE